MKIRLIATTVISLMAAPAFAAHGNPWATEGDTVLGKNHDANQVQSVGTPGKDEMRGDRILKGRDRTPSNPERTNRGSGGQARNSDNNSGGKSGQQRRRGSGRN